MKYILQIFAGTWHAAHDNPEDMIRKIEEISARIPVDKVIIGWNTDAAVYRRLGAYLHEKGIRMVLWFPVFTEISDVAETDQALDLFGQPIVTPAEQAGKAFVFSCPSSRRNIQAVKDVYERYFAECGFDGVFLDRVRSQSFVTGVSGVLSCGCAACRQAFLRKGVDTDAVRERYELKKDAFFDMAAYPMNGQFEMKDPLAQAFFEAKEEIVAEAVTELCRFFKDKGMIVGLDLFAPVVSRFVGQNYPMITKYADFIKPMLYRRTDAPAGIGYEYALFEQHVPGARGRVSLPEGKKLLESQLDAIGCVKCEKFPGVEINYSEDVVRTDADYITESLTAIRDHGFEGAALCWNIMEAPEKHIEAAVRLEKDR